MFGKIAAFELRYQIRQPVFWVATAFFFLMVFGSMTVDNIQIGGGGGGVHKNAPTAIAMTHLVMSIFFIFVTAALVANVIVRDDETGFGPLIRSTRITRVDYLLGRFTGAFAAACLVFLAVPLAIFIGSLAPWLDPETLGPNRLGVYVYAYGALALPSIFLTSALFFALATATRSMMATYIGATALLILWVIMGTLADQQEMREIAAWLDPFGGIALGEAIRYYTTFEANSRLPDLSGALLANRLVWTSAGLVALAVACLLFRFETRKSGRKPSREPDAEPPSGRAVGQALAAPREDLSTQWIQAAHRARLEAVQILRSPAFGILLVLGLFNASGGIFLGLEQNGSVFLPTTIRMIEMLQGAFGFVVVLVAIYYAGDLVWRDREQRFADIVDSTSAPDWTFMVPKVLGLVMVLGVMVLISTLAAAAAQVLLGFPHPDWGQYLGGYALPTLVDWSLIAVLAIFLQALAPNKFVGWALMVTYLVLQLSLAGAGFEHNLYIYGGDPGVPLSDMNGQGDYAGFAAWFRAYWTAFAIFLLILTQGLWARGARDGTRARLARLGRRLKGPTGLAAAGALVVFAGLGSFIFVNTNVWNSYRTQQDEERLTADYEKAFLKYERLPQPSVTDVTLNLDLDPHAPRLKVTGAYDLVNDTVEPLSQLHVRFADTDLKVDRLVLSRPARTETFERFNYRILHLAEPLAPGQRARLEFTTTLAQKGFRNSGNTTRLVDNGTFVSNSEFAPMIGMSRDGLLQDRTKRRKYGLPPELRPAKLEDESARSRNEIGNADWVNADITVTTVADQTPVAPGYLVSDTTANERRTVRFRTDAPVLNFFSVQSARYAVRRETYKGVDLAVYHHPGHPWNVERMMAAMKRSLDYYQANFSPYQFRQARILEFPQYAQYAQSFANTIPFSEALGFTADPNKPDKIDYATYVTAHEMAHQWWGHQIVSADMQGSTVLSESLSQYSALLIMEQTYGPEGIRKFLRNELDAYLAARGGQAVEETPLIRVENQGYIHYRKGSLVMYLLRDQIGEAKVNAALRSLLARYAFKGAPYPTSRDLVDALRREAGDDPRAQDLITDLFEKITLYDLKTEEAQARRRPDGRYDVTLKITARKLYADGKGVETAAPLGTETFDLGVFTAEPGKSGFSRASVQSFTVRTFKDGEQTVTVTVDGKPAFAGIDPYNKRIDRNSGDNVTPVKVAG
ncbi:MAG: aminopeptidase [Phenylobacterium sp.]|nr:aminopeptidase [Phenylobacterium sp.]